MMRVALILMTVVALAGCKQQARQMRDQPAERGILTAASAPTIQPGGPVPRTEIKSPYEGNAYAISEGQRLYGWYNCSGCHFNGGGGIGPPLMNKQLIYGSEPDNIYDSISKGRPRGMPTWGGRIPSNQIWQIVAYVRSLSGQEPKFSSPARNDAMEKKTAAQLK